MFLLHGGILGYDRIGLHFEEVRQPDDPLDRVRMLRWLSRGLESLIILQGSSSLPLPVAVLWA